ncbi:MAG: rhodanese-like domain-containing protein [Balneolaceae bacterium]
MKTIFSIIALIVLALAVFFMTAKKKSSKADTEVETFKQNYQNNPGLVIDVRTAGEFDQGHLKIADYNFDYLSGEFENKLSDLDKDQTYYLHCKTGNRSGQAAEIMKKKGFQDVHNIGGFKDLVNAGFKAE